MTGPADSRLHELRLRAAVLSCYEVSWLGATTEDDAAVERLLMADSVRVVGADGRGYWALDEPLRHDVVRAANRDELVTARAALRHVPADDRQRAIDLCLANELPPVDELDVDQLRAVKWTVSWLAGTLPEIPSPGEVSDRLARHAILAPLRELAREPFVGRDRLLRRLRAHHHHGNRPLLVHGIGGVGKSSLVARYLLDVVEEFPESLVCCLSLEHSGIDLDRPASLVSALARQLAVQVKEPIKQRILAVSERARDIVRTGTEDVLSSSRSHAPTATGKQLLNLLTDLASALAGQRCAVVLDTLEVVQRRGGSALTALGQLVAGLGFASVVLAGRAPAPELRVEEVYLSGLDTEDAVLLLRALVEYPLADAEDIVEQVGTTPLCVRLAAGILAKAPDEPALRDFALRRGTIAGELYGRLLGHIADPDVRKLAHPGLTLRRVTPDVVQRVLAKPCGVAVPDSWAARQLFEALSREAMLVERRLGEDVLVHRADVRQLMLQPLADDDPSAVKRIHLAAVRYYQDRPDRQDRAEELYHRLMLGQRRRTLDAHWTEAALPLLLDSLDELPPASKAYLAAKSGSAAVSDDDLQLAELEVRRDLVHRRAADLVAQGEFTAALDEISRYETETGNRSAALTDVAIQALEFLGDLEQAEEMARQARLHFARHGAPEDFFQFTLHSVRLLERMDRADQADAQLVGALDQARLLPDTVPYQLIRLRLVVYRLRLARHQGTDAGELVKEALDLFEQLPLRSVREVPGLLRDLAAETGEHSPKLLRLALRSVGLTPQDGTGLAVVLRRWDDHVEDHSIAPSGDVEGADWLPWVQQQGRTELGTNLSIIMGANENVVPTDAIGSITNTYRFESDAAIDQNYGMNQNF